MTLVPRPLQSVLLVNPPLDLEARSGPLAAAAGRALPYGLLSLAAVLREAGHPVRFLDAENLDLSPDAAVASILADAADVVGFTTVTQSVDITAAMAARVKANRPDLLILAGGPHLSSVPLETMERFPGFDIGVIGEGEHILLELLRAVREGMPLEAVKGLVVRTPNGLLKTPRPRPIEDLDALPMPAWDLAPGFPGNYRPSAPSYLRLPSATLITSRGCTGRCLFCNSKALHGRLRRISADRVLEMVEDLQTRYGIRDLSIYDDNFVSDAERLEAFCRGLLDRRIDLTWSCYSRVDQGTPELFRLMKKAGCWQISYGIESGSQRILDFLKKDVTLEQIKVAVAATHGAGIKTRGFFMIGHLTETEETIRESMDLLLKLPLDDFHFTAFTPLPGTAAYRLAPAHGAFDPTWSRMNLQNTVFVPHGLTAELLDHYTRVAYRKFYFRPRILWAYTKTLFRNPANVRRLAKGLRAVVTKIFTPA